VVLFLPQFLLGFTTLTIVIAHLVLAAVINQIRWIPQRELGLRLWAVAWLILEYSDGPPSFNSPAIAAGVWMF
jgi:hypothetical protein